MPQCLGSDALRPARMSDSMRWSRLLCLPLEFPGTASLSGEGERALLAKTQAVQQGTITVAISTA